MPITVDLTVTDRQGGTAQASTEILTRPAGRSLTSQSLTETTVIPPGEVWELDPSQDCHLEVTAGSLIVRGVLRSRPAHAGITHLVQFTGVDESLFVGGGMVPLESDRGLWVIGDGKLDLHGAPRTPWRRATESLGIGAVAVELDGDVEGWQPGDELAITPTAAPTVAGFTTLYDYPRIAAVEGRVVHLDRPLKFGHPKRVMPSGQIKYAEVLNLTRNVRVEGTPTGRAHIFIAPEVVDGQHGHTTGQQNISHVGLRWMGPRQPTGETYLSGGVPTPITKNVLGRYALHFHHCGDGSEGSLIEGVVARNTGPAFVPHLSNGIRFPGCIAHDTVADWDRTQGPFWWDVAPDTRTDQEPSHRVGWDGCVASLVRVDPPHRGIRATGFLFGNGVGSTCRGSVAVGVQGTHDASGASWPEGSEDVWTVEDFTAHNNARHGVFTWQNTNEAHEVGPLVCYNNGGAGLSHGAYFNNYEYRDLDLAGNAGRPPVSSQPNLGQLALHANGSAALPQVFVGGHLDGSGLPYAWTVLKHNPLVPVGKSTQAIDYTFTGYTAAAVGFVFAGTETTPELFDFIDCTWLPDLPRLAFARQLLPGSRVRVIESGQVIEAWDETGRLT